MCIINSFIALFSNNISIQKVVRKLYKFNSEIFGCELDVLLDVTIYPVIF